MTRTIIVTEFLVATRVPVSFLQLPLLFEFGALLLLSGFGFDLLQLGAGVVFALELFSGVVLVLLVELVEFVLGVGLRFLFDELATGVTTFVALALFVFLIRKSIKRNVGLPLFCRASLCLSFFSVVWELLCLRNSFLKLIIKLKRLIKQLNV